MRRRINVREDSKSWDVKRLGADRIVPRRFIVSVTYEPDTLPSLEIVVEMIHGVPQCRGVSVTSTTDGQEVLSRHLRDVKVEEWIATGVAMIAEQISAPSSEKELVTNDAQSSGDQVDETIRQLRAARRRPRRGATEARHREVAEVYRGAGNAPTAEVAAHFDVAHRTAAQYVKQARDAGVLGAAIKGRAGEQS